MESRRKLSDLRYLEMTCDGSQVAVRQLLEMFLQTTPDLIKALQKSLLAGDWALLHRNAHKAKSSFMMIGALKTSDILLAIERSDIFEETTSVEALVQQVEQESEIIYDELRTEMDKYICKE